MKKISVLLVFCFLGVSSIAMAARQAVRDSVITTTDRECAIHYLSHANTTGWYLTDVDGSCANGFLDGDGSVLIRNAFGKEVGQLTGFFAQGYWTGGNQMRAPLKDLYLSDAETQTLTFSLGSEKRLNINYIGKMMADRRADDTYGPFQACMPAQVLALTPDVDLFEDEGVQKELINSVINRVNLVCTQPVQIYLYGSAEANPENKDIVFFADINMGTRQIRVKRVPSSSRKRDLVSNPDGPDIPRPREVRQEKALPIMEVKPIKSVETETIEPTQSVKQTIEPVKIPVNNVPAQVDEPVKEPAEKQKTEVVSSEMQVQKSVEPEVQRAAITVSEKEEQAVQPVDRMISTGDAIPNLLTASRLMKQPVAGKALIRIVGFNEDGTAFTDKPVALRVKGTHLSLGWGMAEGMFAYTEPTGALPEWRGFVQITSFVPYEGEVP